MKKILFALLLFGQSTFAQIDIVGGNTPLGGTQNCLPPKATFQPITNNNFCPSQTALFISITNAADTAELVTVYVTETRTLSSGVAQTVNHSLIGKNGVRVLNITMTPSQTDISRSFLIDSVVGIAGVDKTPSFKTIIQKGVIPFSIGVDTTLCAGGVFARSMPAGCTSYTWNTGHLTQGLNFIPTSDITLIGSAVYNGCPLKDTVFVGVNSLPTIKIVGSPNACKGDSIKLYATGATNYSWTTSTGQTAMNTAQLKFLAAASTSVKVVGSSAAGCWGGDTLAITVHSLPVVSVTPQNPVICKNTDQEFVATTPATGATYLWSTGATGPKMSKTFVNPIVAAPYSVTVTDAHGCKSVMGTTISVKDIAKPVAVINYVLNDPKRQVKVAKWTDTTATYSYFWGNPGDYKLAPYGDTMLVSYKPASQYAFIVLTVSNQCGSDEITESIHFVTSVTGIDEVRASRIIIQNPVPQGSIITLPEGEYEIIDMGGRTIGVYQHTISNLFPGNYIILNKKTQQSEKLIVQ